MIFIYIYFFKGLQIFKCRGIHYTLIPESKINILHWNRKTSRNKKKKKHNMAESESDGVKNTKNLYSLWHLSLSLCVFVRQGVEVGIFALLCIYIDKALERDSCSQRSLNVPSQETETLIISPLTCLCCVVGLHGGAESGGFTGQTNTIYLGFDVLKRGRRL